MVNTCRLVSGMKWLNSLRQGHPLPALMRAGKVVDPADLYVKKPTRTVPSEQPSCVGSLGFQYPKATKLDPAFDAGVPVGGHQSDPHIGLAG